MSVFHFHYLFESSIFSFMSLYFPSCFAPLLSVLIHFYLFFLGSCSLFFWDDLAFMLCSLFYFPCFVVISLLSIWMFDFNLFTYWHTTFMFVLLCSHCSVLEINFPNSSVLNFVLLKLCITHDNFCFTWCERKGTFKITVSWLFCKY